MAGPTASPLEDRASSGVIAVAGEALVDFVPAGGERLFEAAPGGSPANVAVGLARLGVRTRMVARIAEDLLGRRLRAHLAGAGVDLSFTVRAAEPSSLAIVALDADGRAEYDFRVQGTADWQWQEGELDGVLDSAPDHEVVAVHAGSLAMVLPPGADALTGMLGRARQTATVSYDPNCRPLLMGSPTVTLTQVRRVVGLADVVKASADDLAWLLPGQTPEAVARAWLGQGPALVAVTLGADGVVAATRAAGVVHRPARRVTVVDTVGAGDAFTSALLAGLHRRGLLGAAHRDALRDVDAGTLAGLLEEATLAAAVTCTRQGAQPPTAEELRAQQPDVTGPA